jgi:hypothetical protein
MQLAVAREDTNELANARCPPSALGPLTPPSPPPLPPSHQRREGVFGGSDVAREPQTSVGPAKVVFFEFLGDKNE